MTPTPDTQAAHLPPDARPGRRLRAAAWAPLLSLILVLVLGNAGAWLVDEHMTTADSSSWGFSFAAAILTVIFAPIPVLATLVTAIGGTVTRTYRGSRRWVVAGMIVATLSGLVVAGFGATVVFTDTAVDEQAFGATLVVASLPALATAALWPLTRTRRHSPGPAAVGYGVS